MIFLKEKTFILIIFITFLIISLSKFNIKQENNSEVFEPNFTFPFYKKEKKQEYIDYKNKTGLPIKEAIIRVNIGLNYPFYVNTKEAKDKGILTLVNKYNYISKDYIPSNLLIINNISINKEAYDNYLKMKDDMQKENLNIRIISAYRSYDYQESLYDRYLKTDKQEIVDSYSARPGFSEHHTGLAIDIDNEKLDYNKFYLTKEFSWMQDNAYKYGFILRYPKDKEDITGYSYEPWHYRYVGEKIASYIKKHNSTYEEYYYEFIDK